MRIQSLYVKLFTYTLYGIYLLSKLLLFFLQIHFMHSHLSQSIDDITIYLLFTACIYTSYGHMTSTRLDWTSGAHVYSIWYINTVLYSYDSMSNKGNLTGKSSNEFIYISFGFLCRKTSIYVRIFKVTTTRINYRSRENKELLFHYQHVETTNHIDMFQLVCDMYFL